MSDDPQYQVHVSGDAHTIRALKKGRKALQRSGIVMMVIGALAIIFPMASTYTVQFIIGATFLVAGVLMLAGSFAMHGTGPFFGALLWSLLMVAVGAFLVFNPAGGAAALTLLIAGLFMVHGAFELFLALSIRPQEGWGWMLASAIVRHLRRAADRRRATRNLKGSDRPFGRHQLPRHRRCLRLPVASAAERRSRARRALSF